MTPQERFWAKVDKSGDCWLWTGKRDRDGYAAQFMVSGRRWAPHRLAYTWAYGGIAPGLDIDHKCHVRHCVRPEHLQAVSHGLNQQNQTGRRRNSSSGGIRGVFWSEHEHRWVVAAKSNGRRHYGGQFTDLREAEHAAIALRNRLMTNNLDDRRAESDEQPLGNTG